MIFDKNPHVTQGAIVENKHLGAVLALAQATQATRDAKRLESRALTVREKARLPAPVVDDASLQHATPFVVEALSLAISLSDARARAANRKTQQAFLARKRAELAALATGDSTDATLRPLRKVVAVGYLNQGAGQKRSTGLLGPQSANASST